MHRRKQIRDAVTAALGASPAVAALATPSPVVEASRVVPADAASLPRVLVYLRGEKADGLAMASPRAYWIDAELVVAYVERVKIGATVPEDRLDLAAEALEIVLSDLEGNRFAGTVHGADYVETDVSVDLSAEQITATVAIRYRLRYERELSGPAGLDDFETNVVTYDIGDATADQQTDTVTLPIV